MRPDFQQLYAELGVGPDCSFDAFRQAYRRLVAEMHPDRPHARSSPSSEDVLLGDLTVLYRKAARFHRRYGRLPGGAAAWSQFAPSPTRKPIHPQTAKAPAAIGEKQPGFHRSLTLAGLIIVLLLIVLLSWDWPSPTPDRSLGSAIPAGTASPPRTTVPAAPASTGRRADRIELGMESAKVLAIQGPPDRIYYDRWDYGPSWIKFHNGKVVDWYSSPLRRLRSDVRTPASPTRLL